jgi:hypothetical protein
MMLGLLLLLCDGRRLLGIRGQLRALSEGCGEHASLWPI